MKKTTIREKGSGLSRVLGRLKGGTGTNENDSYIIMSYSTREFICIGVWPNEEPRTWTADIPSGVIGVNGEIHEMTTVLDLARKAIQRIGTPTYGVAVVHDEFSTFRYYNVGDVPTDQAIAEATSRANQDSPYRVQDGDSYEKEPIAVLCQVFERDDARRERSVATVLFPQKVIDMYQQIFEEIGIPLVKVDTMLFSQLRIIYAVKEDMLRPDDPEAARDVGLVLLNRNVTSVIAFRQGIPHYQRTLELGFEEAEGDLFKSQHLSDEIDRSLDYYRTRINPQSDIHTLWVVGPRGKFVARLQDELRLYDIEVITPDLSDQYTDSHFGLVDSTGVLTALLGALDRSGSEYFTHALNLKARASEGNSGALVSFMARIIPHVAVVAVGVIVWMTASQTLELNRLNRILNDSNLQIQQLESVRSKTMQLKSLQELTQKRRDVLREISDNTYYYPDFFAFVVETLPDEITLNNVAVSGRRWTSSAVSTSWDALIEYMTTLRESPFTEAVDISGFQKSDNSYTFNINVDLAHRGEEYVKRPAR